MGRDHTEKFLMEAVPICFDGEGKKLSGTQVRDIVKTILKKMDKFL